MKEWINIVIVRATSPSKRIGLVLIIVFLVSFFGSAILWNTTNRPFLYIDSKKIFDKTAPTLSNKDTYYVQRAEYWLLMNSKCLPLQDYKKIYTNKYDEIVEDTFSLNLDPRVSKCIIERSPREKIDQAFINSGFTNYAETVFANNFGCLIIILGILGLLLYLGKIQRIIKWIKQG